MIEYSIQLENVYTGLGNHFQTGYDWCHFQYVWRF